jgi:glycosyltransferase involved in cell wall biosynthesis
MRSKNRKPKLLFFTDSQYFAGSENMLAILTSDYEVQKKYETIFCFRKNQKYEVGAKFRLPISLSKISVFLPTLDWLFSPIPIRKARVFNILRGLIYTLCFPIVFALQFGFLVAIFLRVRPQILHVNNGGFPGALSCRVAILAAKFVHIKKIVLVINNAPVNYRGIYRKLDYLIDRLVIRFSTNIVTASDQNLDLIRTQLNVPVSKIKSIPNAVEYRKGSSKKVEIFERFGLSHDCGVIFGVVSEFTPRKGHRFLLNSIRSGVAMHNWALGDLLFLIEGDGPQALELEELSKEMGLEGYVYFVGHVEKIFDLIEILDVMVLPSLEKEDLPNVISEAMLVGKPVIASRVGGTPTQVDDTRTGILINPGDVEAMVAAIHLLSHNRTMRLSMGTQGQLDFQRKFSKSKVVGEYLDLYSEELEVSNG